MTWRRLTLALGGCSWLLLIACGMIWWMAYERTPGKSLDAPPDWPNNAGISLSSQCGTVIMFVHPHCPCTRASLKKLSVALESCSQKAKAYVIVSQLDSNCVSAKSGENFRRAAAIPEVECLIDTEGRLQARFGAATSGYVLYYDSQGALKFSGGLTAERGGDFPGRNDDCFLQILRGEATSAVRTPVFGCAL